MKFATLLVALCVAVAAASTLRSAAETETLWRDFKTTYGRQYAAAEREAYHFGCFQKTLAEIDRLNAVDSARHGINKFADLCASDFKAYHSLRFNATSKKQLAPLVAADVAAEAAADSVDWRSKGAVTAVKDQGACGSCWAFSATGNMEGQWFLAKKKLVSLSEEELVQCSHNGGNDGCNGGLMDLAFDWVKTNGGIDSEADYPYTSGNGNTGSCKSAKLKHHVATFTGGHVDIASDEAQMAAWVLKNGPLSIAVDASEGWQTYSGGIKTSCGFDSLDHGVLIVGYGTDAASGTAYWIVKNSWSTTWGEKGYVRLQRGVKCNGVDMNPCTAKL